MGVAQYEHTSAVLGCNMVISVIDPSCHLKKNCPVVYWLSGLTCTDRNFVEKAGAVEHAVHPSSTARYGCLVNRLCGDTELLYLVDAQVKHGVIIVCPDTSPRGVDIEGDSDSWDFGKGAGFYGSLPSPSPCLYAPESQYLSSHLLSMLPSSPQCPCT